MLDWIDDFFNNIAYDLETIFQNMSNMSTELNELVENLNDYIEFSTYYIYGSGTAILILICMMCVLLSRQKKVEKMSNEILAKLDYNDFAIENDVTTLSDEERAALQKALLQCRSGDAQEKKAAIDTLAEISSSFRDEEAPEHTQEE